jgi:hypothetical protein
MSLRNGSPDGHPKDNDMYTQSELERHYREMTDGSTRPARRSTKPPVTPDQQFAEFFRKAFDIIDDIGPVCE